MIKFTHELTIKKIESKSLRKRDGGTFDFKEVTLQTSDKYPTLLVARAHEDVEQSLREGLKGTAEIAIRSYTTQDNRTFTSFVLTGFATKKPIEPLETALKTEGYNDYEGDDIPF